MKLTYDPRYNVAYIHLKETPEQGLRIAVVLHAHGESHQCTVGSEGRDRAQRPISIDRTLGPTIMA